MPFTARSPARSSSSDWPASTTSDPSASARRPPAGWCPSGPPVPAGPRAPAKRSRRRTGRAGRPARSRTARAHRAPPPQGSGPSGPPRRTPVADERAETRSRAGRPRARQADAGHAPDGASQLGHRAEDGVDRLRVGIEVEVRPHPGHERRQVERSVTRTRRSIPVPRPSALGTAADALNQAAPPGRSSTRPYDVTRPASSTSTCSVPARAWRRASLEEPLRVVERRPCRQVHVQRPVHHRLRRSPRAECSVGVTAKTSRTVSLNWRTLANPACERDVRDGQVGRRVSRVRAVWRGVPG